jgi:hypothetical protein
MGGGGTNSDDWTEILLSFKVKSDKDQKTKKLPRALFGPISFYQNIRILSSDQVPVSKLRLFASCTTVPYLTPPPPQPTSLSLHVQ